MFYFLFIRKLERRYTAGTTHQTRNDSLASTGHGEHDNAKQCSANACRKICTEKMAQDDVELLELELLELLDLEPESLGTAAPSVTTESHASH